MGDGRGILGERHVILGEDWGEGSGVVTGEGSFEQMGESLGERSFGVAIVQLSCEGSLTEIRK